jgi:hypothetical protein
MSSEKPSDSPWIRGLFLLARGSGKNGVQNSHIGLWDKMSKNAEKCLTGKVEVVILFSVKVEL